MTFEDKILAYLDGSLGESERSELLHSLSISPEKQSILEEHLRMRDLFVLGRRPMNVPANLERALAERLPILGEPVRESAPLAFASAGRTVTSSLQVVRSFFLAHTLATLLMLGIIVVGVGMYYGSLSSDRATIVRKANGAANSLVTSIDKRPEEGVAANNDVRGASATDTRTASDNTISRTGQGTASNGIDTHHAISGLVSRHRMYPSAASFGVNSHDGAIASNLDRPASTMQNTKSGAVQATNEGSTTRDPETELSTPAPRVQAILTQDREVPHSLREIARATEGHASRLMMAAYVSSSTYILPQQVGVSSPSTTTAFHPEISLMYDLSPNWRVGLNGGSSIFSLVNQESASPTSFLNTRTYQRAVYESNTQTLTTEWVRATGEFVINPESDVAMYLGAGAGVAFESRMEPIAAISFGATHAFSSHLIFDIAAIGTEVWGTPGTVVPIKTYEDGITGVLVGSTPIATHTSAIGIRVGFRFQP